MTKRLTNRCAVVTGSGQGIGRAVALRLAEEGAAVVLNSRGMVRPDGQPTAFDSCNAILAAGGRAIAVAADVSTAEGAQALCQAATQAFGAIDILVNNAGGSDRGVAPLEEMSEETWDFMFASNMKSQFLCTRLVVPQMRRSGWGRIVNMGSPVGILGMPGMTAYGAAKAASMGFTASLAAELAGTGVTANCVLPIAMTERAKRSQKLRQNLTGFQEPSTPDRTPEAVAMAITYLTLPEAADISGHLFNVVGSRINHLLCQPAGCTLNKNTPWTLDELIELFPASFDQALRAPSKDLIA